MYLWYYGILMRKLGGFTSSYKIGFKNVKDIDTFVRRNHSISGSRVGFGFLANRYVLCACAGVFFVVVVVNQKVKEKKALLFRMSTNHLDIVNDIFIVLARLWSNQVRMQEYGNVYILVTRHSFISQTKIDTHDNLETHYIYKIILVYWYILTMRLICCIAILDSYQSNSFEH